MDLNRSTNMNSKNKKQSNSVFERLTSKEKIDDLEPMKSFTPYFPIIQQLQSKFSEFDEASLRFPALQLPDTRKKKNSIRKYKTKSIELEKTSMFMSKTKTKLRDFKESSPYTLNLACTIDFGVNNIGPGSYRTEKVTDRTGGNISVIPRFKTGTLEKAEEFLNLKSKINMTQSIIRKNKDLEKFTLRNTLIKALESKRTKDIEEEIHYRTKINIIKMIKEAKQKKYTEKIERFEWRSKKSEIFESKFAWFVLMSGISFSTMILYKHKHLKRHKKATYHCHCFLYLTSRYLGKMKRILYRIRARKLRNLLLNCKNKIILWLNRRKRLHRALIHNTVINCYKHNIITSLMVHLKDKVSFLKVKSKELMLIKKARFYSLGLLFTRLAKKNRSLGISSLTPEKEISQFYYSCVSLHLIRMARYQEELKQFVAMENILATDEFAPQEVIPKPIKPVLFLFSRSDEFLQLLTRSLRKKAIKNNKKSTRKHTRISKN